MKRSVPMITAAVAALVAALGAPVASAQDATSPYVFVPNRGSADVAVIDSRTDRVVARIEVGNVPHQVVLSTSLGKLITSNTADNTISIVSLDGFAVEATIALDAGPEHLALNPAGDLLAVGNFDAGTVSLVSLRDNRETARISGLFEPHNLTFSPDGTLLYAANLGANHVTVIDVAAATVVNEIRIAEPAAYGAVETTGEFQGIINVTPTLDGRLGFAAHGEGDVVAVIDLATQQTVKRIAVGDRPWRAFASADGRTMLVPNNGDRTVSVISTATLEVIAILPGAADMTGINSTATTAFVISRGDNKIVVIDLAAMTVSGEIALPGAPETGVITRDGGKLYVALGATGQMAVIDTRTATLVALIDGVGVEPWGATMAGVAGYCH